MNGFFVDYNEPLVINDVVTYTRAQIRAARIKWAEFLMVKGRKKATGRLDEGGGARCCLGHGCYILGVKSEKMEDGGYEYDESTDIAPTSFIEMVGLWDDTGITNDRSAIELFAKNNSHELIDLASVNDDTAASPRRIGAYLLSVVDGGENTPFRPLTDYPE